MFAGSSFDDLRRVLREAADDQQRIAASWVIGYAPDKAAVAAELQAAMRDPDGTVRNNAVRALGVIATYARLHPDLGIRIPCPALLEMARWKSPDHAFPAFTLLGRVAGMSEEDIRKAWSEGGREEMLARVQVGIGAHR